MIPIYLRDNRLESAVVRFLESARGAVDLVEREILGRLGFRGMLAATLPALTLAQVLCPGMSLFGGARLPLLWCGVLYFVLRFRLARGLEAAAAGALLAWVANRFAFWSDGLLLFGMAAGFAVLRWWLYTEFWLAHAFAALSFVAVLPVLCFLFGVTVPFPGVGAFLGTLFLAPLVSTILFGLLNAFRRRLELPEDMPGPAQPEPAAGVVRSPRLAGDAA